MLLIRSNKLYRRQVIALLPLTFIPGLSGLFGSLKLPPYPYFDPSSIALSFTFMFVAFNIFRMRLGDIIPVAREVVVESMSDGVIVLDGQNRIVDLNPVAQYVIDISTSDLIGHRIDKVWSSWPSQIGKL
jgi:PAS domain-containing protein